MKNSIALAFLFFNYNIFTMQRPNLKNMLGFFDIPEKFETRLNNLPPEIKSSIYNNNIWYQFVSITAQYRVNTLHYSHDGKELFMKGENNKETSIPMRRLASDCSIPKTIPFLPKIITFPFNMHYVSYDPIRPEIAVAYGKQKVGFWKKYEANVEQIVLLRTMQTWMCLKKPDKSIIKKESLLSAIVKELNLYRNNFDEIWNEIPGALRSQWLNILFNQIQKYGK